MKKSLFGCSISSVVLLVVFNSNVLADDLQNKIDDIVLKDETQKSLMKQDKIIGCDDTLKIKELKCSKERTPEDRDKDIDEIKSQLSEILKQLAELKKEKDTKVKDNKLDTIQKSIKQLTIISKEDNNTTTQVYQKPKKIKVIEKRDDCVIVEVQSGESLSKYAFKYYGDGRKYSNIYRANRDKISEDLQIYIGDRLIIPTSSSYQYPPEPKKETKEEPKAQESNISENIEEIIIEENNTNVELITVEKVETNEGIVNRLNEVVYVGDDT